MAGAVELPRLTEGYLGPQAKFFPYGLTTLSHSEPVIHSDSNRVEIVIGTSQPMRFMTKLLGVNPKGECNQFVFTQKQGDEFHFTIAVPRLGFFKFQIYALPNNEAGPNMINVYNYLLNVQQTDTYVEAFPKQYPLWKQQGCYVFEPVMIMKGQRDPVKFKYYIPVAVNVQIKVGEDWNQLEEVEAGTGIYEGLVDFSQGYPAGTKVRLNVKSGRTHKYDILLEYTI
ncbi:uncharacterized protein LOC110455394 [Mizuhopecten yessoensis]|uniref:uncharacterized protein LOC110455394 n=1 Tax=Mizuhopecten yessoensis TaxID=6573 RepID=UPI000B45F7F3|nr:uncharacterized protein LOC110455394 [Mizuhopecten yessoensis]